MASPRELFDKLRGLVIERWDDFGEVAKGWLKIERMNDPDGYRKGYIDRFKKICEQLKDHPEIDQLVKAVNTFDDAVLDAMRKKRSGKLTYTDEIVLEGQLQEKTLELMAILRKIEIQEKQATAAPPPKPPRLSPEQQAAFRPGARPLPSIPVTPPLATQTSTTPEVVPAGKTPGSTTGITREMQKAPAQSAPVPPAASMPAPKPAQATDADIKKMRDLSLDVKIARKQMEKSLKRFQKEMNRELRPSIKEILIHTNLVVLASNFAALQTAVTKAKDQTPDQAPQDDPKMKELTQELTKADRLIRRIEKPKPSNLLDKAFKNISTVKNAAQHLTARFNKEFADEVAKQNAGKSAAKQESQPAVQKADENTPPSRKPGGP